jgi:hypothetical protein
MTPKEKAKELFNKFCYAIRTEERGDGYYTNIFHAKECALIAINEMLDWRNHLFLNENSLAHQYLQKIKEEIEAL